MRAALEKYLKENGWKQDSFGHWKKEIVSKRTGKPTLYRIKMQNISCRLERRERVEYSSPYSKDENIWVKLYSCYYKDITFDPANLRPSIGKIVL